MGKLIKCKDCGNQVSKKAKSCPNCGSPLKQVNFIGCLSATIITCVFFVYFIGSLATNEDSTVFNKVQLNLREGAGTEFKVLSALEAGEKLEILEEATNGWVQVEIAGGFFGEDRIGWVNKKYTYSMSDYPIWKSEHDKQMRIEYEKNWNKRDNKSMAYIKCEGWVKEKLKSPSTADFPSLWSGKLDNVIRTDQRYIVKSYVDAQNSFGATVRSNFTCSTTQYQMGSWKLNFVEVD